MKIRSFDFGTENVLIMKQMHILLHVFESCKYKHWRPSVAMTVRWPHIFGKIDPLHPAWCCWLGNRLNHILIPSSLLLLSPFSLSPLLHIFFTSNKPEGTEKCRKKLEDRFGCQGPHAKCTLYLETPSSNF